MGNLDKAQDSSALKNRIHINEKHSQGNLNDWIFSLFHLKSDSKVLDICCGRGNQTFIFSEICKNGVVYALDISKESLEDINSKKYANISTLLMDVDNIDTISLDEGSLDCVHCAYGLYYSKKPKMVIRKVYSLLKSGGIFVVVGPADDNNSELFNFIEKLYKIDKDIIFSSRDFMNTIVLPECTKLFSNVETSHFTNKITYPDSDSLYTYIKSSTMYKDRYDKSLRRIINEYFEGNKEFVVTKKVKAAVAIK